MCYFEVTEIILWLKDGLIRAVIKTKNEFFCFMWDIINKKYDFIIAVKVLRSLFLFFLRFYRELQSSTVLCYIE